MVGVVAPSVAFKVRRNETPMLDKRAQQFVNCIAIPGWGGIRQCIGGNPVDRAQGRFHRADPVDSYAVRIGGDETVDLLL